MELEFAKTFDALSDAIVVADDSNRILYANRATERLLAWPAGGLLGQPLTALMPERMHAAHQAGFARYVATREARIMGRPVRVPARRRDGVELDIELTLSTLAPTAGGELVVALLRDLRDRVELERQLTVTRYMRAATTAAARLTARLDEDHVLRTFVAVARDDFDAALARVWLHRPESGTLHLSASAGVASEMTTSSRDVIDVATYPYKVGVVARTLAPFMKNGLAGDPEFEQTWIAREGLRAVACLPLVARDRLLGVVVAFFRRPLEEEVFEILATLAAMLSNALEEARLFRTSTERLTLLAAASALLASSLDFETTVAHAARLPFPALGDFGFLVVVEPDGAARRFACAATDATRRALDAAPIGADVRALGEGLGARSTLTVPIGYEGRLLGGYTLFHGESARVHDRDDELLAAEIAHRVAAALENARLFRAATQAVRIRDDFLSIAAHELRTPLTSLDLHARAAVRLCAGDPAAARERLGSKLERIVVQVDRLRTLIDGLLDVSRIGEGRVEVDREPMDLASLARDVVARLADDLERAGCELRLDAPDEVTGEWDVVALDQILTNLVTNAMKYGKGHPIEVRIASTPDEARVALVDHGIGVAPADQPRIFGRFERAVSARNYGGLGLGLWISHRLAAAHGGELSVESALGQGSTFTLVLPRKPTNS